MCRGRGLCRLCSHDTGAEHRGAQDDREQRSLHMRRHDTGAGRGGGGGHRRGFDTFFAKTTAYMVSLKARVFPGVEDTGFVTGTYHLEPRGRKRSRQTGI